MREEGLGEAGKPVREEHTKMEGIPFKFAVRVWHACCSTGISPPASFAPDQVVESEEATAAAPI